MEDNKYENLFGLVVENVLQEYDIQNSNTEHIQNTLDVMSQNLDNQYSPKVGIFWYDERTKSLFGVIAIDKDSFSQPNVGGGLITCRELHKYVWAKAYNKQKYKFNGNGPFQGDYKDTPRGRIFYNPSNNQFIINVGSWIKNNMECVDEILDEFELRQQDYKIEIAPHWEIGCGYGD
jgi:hypothetical protein